MSNPYLGTDCKLSANMSWGGNGGDFDVSVNRRGDINKVDDIANVRQALLARLNTRKGDLWAHTDYGNDIFDRLSSNLTATMLALAMSDIEDCINADPRAECVGITHKVDYLRRYVEFTITYRVLDGREDSLVLPLQWEAVQNSV